jgi:translation initiation factor 2B subunit (eIF-2B alpha/beta/delta family)
MFQDRWVRDAKELRLQRKVQRMRLQSDAAQLRQEVAAAQESLRSERRYQQSLEQELRQVQRARLANSQSGQWQLGAVQLYHNRVVQAAPVRLEAKLMDLQQQQKVSRLQLQTLKSRIDMQRQRLHAVTRKLAADKG